MTQQTTLAAASSGLGSRTTGVIYLLYFLTAISSGIVLNGIIVPGDAAATSTHILSRKAALQGGLGLSVLSLVWYIALTARLYALFKPVYRNLSLLAAFFSLVGCTIQACSSLFQFAPLLVLDNNRYMGAFNTEQVHALLLLFLDLHSRMDSIALVFFGFYCLSLGYLLLRSAFLPRILGVLMTLAGLGWITFLSPPFARSLSPYNLALGILAEASLMGWLLIAGVNIPKWKEQAGT